jgi:hypothetical protein
MSYNTIHDKILDKFKTNLFENGFPVESSLTTVSSIGTTKSGTEGLIKTYNENEKLFVFVVFFYKKVSNLVSKEIYLSALGINEEDVERISRFLFFKIGLAKVQKEERKYNFKIKTEY